MLLAVFWVCVFIISIVFLVKSSGYFTEAAEKVGVYFGLSPFIIGVTIVAVGTSLPELISSLVAVFAGSSEIVVGNVIGSNIANIFLVLGITAIVGRRMSVAYELISVDLPLLIGSALLLGFLLLDGSFGPIDGIISLALLLVYLLFTARSERHSDKEITKEMKTEERELRSALRKRSLLLPLFTLFITGFFIYFSATYTVKSVINLAGLFGTGTDMIAITAVALGTSLPELSVTIAAARKKKAEIAVGNILGSNIFNALAVMGIPSLFGALTVPTTILLLGLPVMIAATFLYLFITQDKVITKWEGWLLVIFYAAFLCKLFGLV